MAFELLSGRVPFTADTAVTLLLKHVHEAPPRIPASATVPGTLVELVDAMLAKGPLSRPKDGGQVAMLFSAILANMQAATSTAALADTLGAISNTMVLSHLRARSDISSLAEVDLTAVCFELAGFSRKASQELLPTRVAFILESWLRLVHRVITEHGGVIDRNVADKVTAFFGFPDGKPDHASRAFDAAIALDSALLVFNKAHDLSLQMRVGIACGPSLVGHIVGDVSATTATGSVLADMGYLSKSSTVAQSIRLTKTAYRRVSAKGNFQRLEDAHLGELWVFAGRELPEFSSK